MDEKYICYCGLYCENCATKAKVEPAAKTLYAEMQAAGFEDIVKFIHGGDNFWSFLKNMAENGTCSSCRAGSGNPACAIRICAKEKGVIVCASCGNYPCGKFDELFSSHSNLKQDNELLKEDADAWAKLQDERRINGFTYAD